MRKAALLVLLFGLAGAAEARTASSKALRSAIVERARGLVGVRSLRTVTQSVPDDCTGFVRHVYGAAGVELMGAGRVGDNGVTAIWRNASSKRALRKKVHAGDLVFFRETYDRNGDGLRNDGLTHVGIVESVSSNGTITFLHRGGKGIERSHFNPYAPNKRIGRNGTVINDYLRAKSANRRAYLAGELFVVAASPVALK